MKNNNFTINAEGRTLGRVASEAARILMGKNSPEYTPNQKPTNKVTIENASKTKMSEKRMLNTLHEKYSGYPGGLKVETNKKIISRKGFSELYKLAVYNMLPSNKLRAIMMKNLEVKE